MSRKTIPARGLATMCIALLLAGCSGDLDSPAAAASGGGMPPASALPDCDDVAALTDGFVEGWLLAKDSGPWQHNNDRYHSYGVECSWLSPRTQSGNVAEMMQGAAFSVLINVHPARQTEAEARSTGMVVDDRAVEDIGAYLVFPGHLEFDKPVGAIAPDVVKGKISIAIGQSGMMLVNEIDEGKPMTNRRAVDTAVAVHRLIRW